ncbi:hypothetical protein IAR55_006100 [Kwoniella newhampshirensis]|uniref:General transcriptional repressor n=1 Tax=Kwoniella newhampshirensis TaxID=1651941 RepID=A0AAW0YF22_9TREE
MPDARMSHSSHHHHHSHSSHPYPSHGPPTGYPPSSSHPSYHHHQHHNSHSSRHISNGPPPAPVIISGPPPPMAISGPPPEAVGPPPVVPIGNGHAHPGPSVGPPMSPAARAAKEKMDGLLAQLANANENTWMLIGAVAEGLNNQDRALTAFENALRHNPSSILGLNAVASIARSRDNFDKAIEYFQRILNMNQDNGEVWGSMGHCLLMKDDLPKAYTAYQQALYHLPNPKEPKLWYGIGILYDRYGSFDHAEEAFSSVLKMDPNFEKANEIYFRLGIIYKTQRKYSASLECFRYILNNPPRPLTSWDIWFQLGHVYEQDRDYEAARDAYMRVLNYQPDHAKVLQQLGWLHHQPGAPFADQDKAVAYLTKSLETDGTDAQSWYLLGRAFMAGQRYNKAYEAYQQAVYRDGRNPTFWCSIGVLYYQINQYRDALDAYSRAIRLNPYISEVWYNLGSLYESCNNQITDAIDAYSRAAELDPGNATIKQRLSMLQNAGNAPLPPAPGPVDVHPSQYSATPSGQPGLGGSPGGSPRGHPTQLAPADGPTAIRDLPPPPPGAELGRGHSPGPFRGGVVPPPLAHVDESRGSLARQPPLAPMDLERPDANGRERDSHREPPHFNGGGRYDSAGRHADSLASPRRRESFPAPPGYSAFAPPNLAGQQPSYSRDRDREEWERNRERTRAPPGGPPDHRGPSPRMQERAPHPHIDPRRQPSPRIPQDYRGEYGRPSDVYPPPGYGYDSRGAFPPGPDPRFDPRREVEEVRREGRRFDERPEANGSLRHASISRDVRTDDPRAPSPAPSNGSKAGSKRRSDGDKVASSKRQKDDKPTSKKGSGDVGKKDKLPSLKVVSREEDGASPRPTVASSPSVAGTPHQTPQKSVPSRTVDEDYDEGAADALMALHGDRPPTSSKESSVRNRTPGGDSHSPIAQATAGHKRIEPPSPTSPANGHNKKAKAGYHEPSAPAARRMVIEVLNTPSIGSPLPGSTPAASEEKMTDARTSAPAAAPAAESASHSEQEEAIVTAPTPKTETSPAPPAEQEKDELEDNRQDSRPPTPPLPGPDKVTDATKTAESKGGDVTMGGPDAEVESASKTEAAVEKVEAVLSPEKDVDNGDKAGSAASITAEEGESA